MTTTSREADAVQEAVTAVLQNNFDAVSAPCLLTILKLLDNIIQKPHDPKFRTVKLTNAVLQSKIGQCKGGVEVLKACGFVGNDGDSCLVLPESAQQQQQQQEALIRARHAIARRCVHELKCKPSDLPKYKPPPAPVQLVGGSSGDTSNNSNPNTASSFNPYQGHRFDGLSAAAGTSLGPDSNYKSTTQAELDRLERQRQRLERKLQPAQLQRDWTMVPASSSSVGMPAAASTTSAQNESHKSSGDAGLLAARAQTLQAEKLQREQGGFTTKAMRQVAQLQKQKVYAHTALQIQFPDGTKLCGKFLPSETVETVQAALRSDCLQNSANADFDLYVAPPRRLLPRASTLQAEGLVPAAKLFVSWKVSPPAPSDYLQAHLLQPQTTNALLFPASQPIVGTPASSAAAASTDGGDAAGLPAKKKKSSNREEDMLKRMMGGGLGGGGKKR